MRRLFRKRETPQRYDPGTVPYSDCSSDMVYSMACVVSEYFFHTGRLQWYHGYVFRYGPIGQVQRRINRSKLPTESP